MRRIKGLAVLCAAAAAMGAVTGCSVTVTEPSESEASDYCSAVISESEASGSVISDYCSAAGSDSGCSDCYQSFLHFLRRL